MRAFFPALTALVLLPAALPAGGDKARTFTFSKTDAGKAPAGWKVDATAKDPKGAKSAWSVVADDSAPGKTGHALMQTGESAGPAFNLCVAEDTSYLDLETSVAFKAMAGDKDQGGGIVWRYQDNNNYYLARMNPLEDNLRVYKVVDGKRIELGSKEGLKVPAGTWHTLRIRQVGKKIEVALDGKVYLEVEDETITRAGKVGLWTKADAQTRFDVFAVQALTPKQ